MVSGGELTITGMSVVFLALGLLALAAWVLERIFRVREPEAEKTESSDVEAAIALALFLYTGKKGSIYLEKVGESMWLQQTRVYT
ncbi:MAG: OadG family protein [Theionarchaea archaeon]|nr:OadG family protein [Theionarchaea archaeon]